MKEHKIFPRGIAVVALALCMVLRPASSAQADPGGSGLEEPAVQAEGAVVIDAASGEILYGKNASTRYYPASITKLMTALLVVENCGLDDTVTFSRTATTGLESGAVTLGLVEGDRLTVRQCLYALLLKSANEVANGLAEHVAGSVPAFAERMNQKAAALGCTNTHFVNPHGLNDPDHYTTPYDMALIARAAFAVPALREIGTTLSYTLPATKNSGAVTVTMGHKMMYPSDSRYYEGIIGGKTGYTSLARNTLVTGAERNGVRLVAVVMKSSGTHYADTKALLDYGFAKMAARGAGSLGPSAGPQSSPPASQPQVSPSAGPGTGTAGQSGPGTGMAGQSGPGTGTAGQSGPGTETAGQSGPGTGTASQSGPGGNAAGQPAATGWIQDAAGWYYIKADGSRAAGEWLLLSDADYWIDGNGYMANGWRLFTNGDWYYFRSSGAMATDYWVEDNGKWFYLGSQGAMLKNTVTPDGYTLGADGVWIEEVEKVS